MTPRNAPLTDDPRLKTYFEGEEERRALTRDLFNEAAVGYDSAESLTAMGSGAWYRRDVLRRCGLRPGMRLLDVAAGTGLVTVAAQELVGLAGHVTALDPSPGMLAELRKKIDVQTIEAFAESIPLPDASFDFVSMGYALRHVADLDQAFGEYLRVLRPGGQVCIMEISRPASRLGRVLLRAHISVVVPALATLTRQRAEVGKLWEYYGDTIEAAVDPASVLDALRRAGFVDVHCHVTMGVFREYVGRRP
ncbi:demethylmenaquinone methyltransferase/2-methoxy-6-polyprenyl-1,4-benzoquinol methylase [Hydrogenophaga palleronii]|uniref:Demethylmenaquinone methyltransferase/2-methoxy-6-polyprenyl-1,4-benzoquinol methylase n=1 Tax=Hydrogenophaga palleronii TaxID=65655 RepID=A0ABU1WU25_9BURK|nr:class I SAM-dependent methyltransferase [Hydrogenophaga palleronii]MDR7152446.1 demethylmenaquinone methyltransferase/2-methoxy-6-polyprenyl-1,4-benzoquinol methylase [Hydrogenophaga palleronii]